MKPPSRSSRGRPGRLAVGAIAFALFVAGAAPALSAETAAEWTALSKSEAESDPAAALIAIDKAIALEDAAFRRYEKATLLQRLHRDGEAVVQFEAARTMDPANANIAFALAYAYRAAGRNREAAAAFEAGLARAPERFDIVEDLAYALKADGQFAEAARRFREVLANKERYARQSDADKLALAKRLWRVHREIGALERGWYATAFVSYLSSGASDLPSVLNSNPFTSQGGAEMGWSPQLGDSPERNVDLFARSYFSFRRDTFDYDPDSLQFGVGIRWKPFEDQDLRLTLERMIESGDNARDAWLTRASYSWSAGADIDPFGDNWNYTSLYLDLADIPERPRFFSAYGQAIEGWRFRLGEASAFTPHGVIAAQYTGDQFHQDTTVEIGAGVTLSRWYDDDAYPLNEHRVDLTLEYRVPVTTGVRDDDHLLLQLIFSR